MLRATVPGAVWATRRIEKLPTGAFLEVEVDGGTTMVSCGVLGRGLGARVRLARGTGPSGRVGDGQPPLDCRYGNRQGLPGKTGQCDRQAARRAGHS